MVAGPSIGGYGVGVCFGLVLICLCYCIGNISGCHVNPAVSFGVWLSGRMSFKDMLGYWVFQMAGALVGAAFLYWCVNMNPEFNFGGVTGENNLATNVLQPGATSGMALLVEILLTFFFVFIILGPTDPKLVNIVGIPVDNCSVNPARSFGPAVFSPGAFADYWIMVVGPLVGAAVAVAAWKAVSPYILANKK